MNVLGDIADKVTHIFDSSEESKPDEEAYEQQLLNEKHRYDSFAAVRHEAEVKFFVDGQNYCWAVSEAIENATESIYIEDWWLHLRRPPSKYPEYRIDTLLKKKADEGVKIYIVVYKEVELALTLDSEHTKHVLDGLSENVTVLRHPDHNLGGTFFWSHHEKFVVIDNKIAFLGGIDLCFGRWDTHGHPLADFHGDDPDSELFPVKDYDMRLIDKTVIPRMPWHDMSMCLVGGPVLDVARHFCERWNFIKHEKARNIEAIPYLQPPLGGMGRQQHYFEENQEEHVYRKQRHNPRTRGVKGTMRVQVLRSSAKWSTGEDLEHSIQNAYVATILGAEHYVYIENQFFITSTEPDNGGIVKNQIGNAIVRRIVRAHEEREKFKVFVLIPLMPAFPADLSTKDAATARLVMHYQYISICRGPDSIVEKLKASGIDPDEYIRFYSLRNYDRINRSKLESLLLRAAGYEDETEQRLEGVEGHEGEEAQVIHHAGEPEFARNTQGSFHIEDEVEYGRIPNEEDVRHYREKTLEGIAADSIAKDAMEGGNLDEEPWVNDTETSRPRTDEAEREEAGDYVTEELYIHAKLLIADDKRVIMGSANLNDRSQCGDRDSEIALIVEDMKTIPSQMNGHYYEAPCFAATLRRNLWKEHLGLIKDAPADEVTNAMLPLPTPQIDTTDTKEDKLVMDPLDENTLDLFNSTAKKNTLAYRHVFRCVPDDTVTDWEEYKEFYPNPTEIDIGHIHDPEMSVDEIRDHLGKVKGHLVEFPYHFLENIDLHGESIPFVGNDIQELYT
ncbi:hypothetical protein BY458DRAFT_533912 [Sporodiniella umbellata]|nr:hypothetical protein BY458DRAFT_533912 [Sporodiniella umbellata]